MEIPLLKPPSDTEWLAAQVVRRVVGASAIFVDDGLASARHDWEIRPAHGQPFALEVSRIVDQEAMSVAGALGTPWPLVGLKCSWQLYVRAGSDLGKIKRSAASVLKPFEQAGGQLFSEAVHGAGADPVVTPELRREMAALGIEIAHVWDVPGPPAAAALLGGGFRSSPGKAVAVNRAVEEVACDNAAKLLSSGLPDKHLFLWIEDVAPAGVLGALIPDPHFANPDQPPRLPSGVDEVWVAHWPTATTVKTGQPVFPTSKRTPVKNVLIVEHLWRVRPPEPWARVGNARLFP